MSAHETISNQLSAYLDGELSPVELKVVEAALAKDPTLVAQLDELRATRALLRALPAMRLPDGFAQRVARQANGQAVEMGTSRWIRYAAAAAIVAISAGVGMVVSQSIREPLGEPTHVASRTVEPAELLAARSKESTLKGKLASGVSDEMDEMKDAVRDVSKGKTKGWVESDLGKEIVATVPTRAKKPGLDGKDLGDAVAIAEDRDSFRGDFKTKPAGEKWKKSAEKICVGEGALAKRLPGVGKAREAGVRLRGGPAKVGKRGKGGEYDYATNVELAKGLALDRLAALTNQDQAGDVIFIDDLAAGEKAVETVLAYNGVQLAHADQRAVYYNQGMNLGRNIHFEKEAKTQRRVSDLADGKVRQVQYVIYDSPERINAIRTQLRSLVQKQAQLRVSQLPEGMYQKALVVEDDRRSGRLASSGRRSKSSDLLKRPATKSPDSKDEEAATPPATTTEGTSTTRPLSKTATPPKTSPSPVAADEAAPKPTAPSVPVAARAPTTTAPVDKSSVRGGRKKNDVAKGDSAKASARDKKAVKLEGGGLFETEFQTKDSQVVLEPVKEIADETIALEEKSLQVGSRQKAEQAEQEKKKKNAPAKPATVVAGLDPAHEPADSRQQDMEQGRQGSCQRVQSPPQAIVITLRYREPVKRLNSTQQASLQRMELVQTRQVELRMQKIQANRKINAEVSPPIPNAKPTLPVNK